MDTDGTGPKTRSGSQVLAHIQDNAIPLDKPIRFGKTTIRNGKTQREGKSTKYVNGEEYYYDAKGQLKVESHTKLVKWEGKYHRVNKAIAGDLDDKRSWLWSDDE